MLDKINVRKFFLQPSPMILDKKVSNYDNKVRVHVGWACMCMYNIATKDFADKAESHFGCFRIKWFKKQPFFVEWKNAKPHIMHLTL